MATANIISAIGTSVDFLGFVLENVPQLGNSANVRYMIATDGANGDLSNAEGHLPDLRMWYETGEFLGGHYDPGYCRQGHTTCVTAVDTPKVVT